MSDKPDDGVLTSTEPYRRLRRTISRVAAGHASRGEACIQIPPDEIEDKPKTILKVLDETELEVYSKLAEHQGDPILEFIPQFLGVVEDLDEKGAKLRFIRIGNLLHDYHRPKVMDVKLGCRTFLESEVQSKKPRPDLFERMAKLYPEELTSAERDVKTVTKHRWMTVRDDLSTIKPLAYRIDGLAGYRRGREISPDQLADLRTYADTCRTFRGFAEETAAAEDDSMDPDESDEFAVVDSTLSVAQQVKARLVHMLEAMKASHFVEAHEFIGSSILVVADGHGRSGVYWIDFAKTYKAPGGLTHACSWKPGNHEDGIIRGMDNLIKAWDKVISGIQNDEQNYISSMSVQVGSSFLPSGRRLPRRLPGGLVGRQLRRYLSMPRLGRRKKAPLSTSDSDTSETNDAPFNILTSSGSDVGTLSSLPSFSGVVSDTPSRVWCRGRAVATAAVVDAAVAAGATVATATIAGAAVGAQAVVAVAGGTGTAGRLAAGSWDRGRS